MKLGLLNVHSTECLNYGIVGANGVAYLAAYLKKNFGLEDIFIAVDEKELKAQKPDVLGISSTTENYSKAIAIAREIKDNLNIPIIIGGHHISAIPKALPPFIDAGVIGEGEQAILELLSLIQQDKFTPEELAEISGIVFHNQQEKIITPKRPVIDELDSLPFPERRLLKTIKGYNQSLLTTRGCPFDCSFCSATSFWKKVRFHSPERIIAEIEEIMREFPEQRMINIDDDLFTINTPRLKKLVQLIKENDIDKKVEFSVTARTSVFSESICRLLQEMNVKRLFIGFEYGVNRILKYLKETVKVKQNQKAIDLCAKYNMNVVGSFIVGVPIETREELAENYWFIRKNYDTLTKVNICFSNPFPDTGFWDDAVKKGKIDDSFTEWWRMSLEYHPERSLFMNENYSKAEFNDYYRHFTNLQKKSTVRPVKDSPYTSRYVNLEYLKSLYQRILELIPPNVYTKIEISSQIQTIDELLDIESGFVTSNRLEFEQNRCYDFIACVHYLETVEHPEQELCRFSELLDEKGTLLLAVYNMAFIQIIESLIEGSLKYSYAGAFQKSHRNMFTLQSMEKLLKRAGLRLKKLVRNTAVLPINQTIKNALSHYSGISLDFSENQTLSFIFLLEKEII